MQESGDIEEYIVSEDLKDAEKGGWKGKLTDFLEGKYFVPVAIVLVAITAFSLGRISGLQDKKPPVRVVNSQTDSVSTQNSSVSTTALQNRASAVASASSNSSGQASSGQVVASKTGTKYHYPWCAGAKQISAKNLITFNSIEEARAAGYTPASNCKGLK